MPFRAWLFIAALGLILTTSGQASAQLTEDQRPQAGQDQTESQGQDSASQDEPVPFAVPVRILDESEQTERAEREQKESAERERKDLIAQESVAESTQWIVGLTGLQFVLAVFGTIALLYSIALNRNATFAALAGAKASQEGTAAAREAIAVTREMNQRQLRAYIAEDKFEWAPIAIPKGIIITHTFRNCGATPARNVRLRVFCVLERHDGQNERVADSALDPKPYGEHDIGPAMSFVYQQHIGSVNLADGLQGTREGTMHMVVISEVEYADVFGDEWHTCTAMVIDPTYYEKTEKIQFVRYPKGNKST